MNISIRKSLPIIFIAYVTVSLATGCRNSFDRALCCAGDSLFSYKEPASIPGIKIDSAVLNTQLFRDAWQQNGFYANFGYQFIQRDTTTYICFMNGYKTAIVISPIDSHGETFVTDVSGIMSGKDRQSNKITGDTLHLIKNDKFEYGQYVFDSAFQLRRILELNIKESFPRHSFINDNIVIPKKIAYSHPYLFVPYGRFGKKNEIDIKAAMRIDVRDGSGLKLVDYPATYNSCPDRRKYPIVDIINGDLYSLFLDDEQISVTNIASGELQVARQVPFTTRYMCFDKEQEENLAYTSKYDLNNEINLNLIYNNDYFYLIKRLRKADKKQRSRCVVLVFDKQLNYQFAFYPYHHVLASASVAYRQGVLIFSDKLNEAYYYAFKKEKQ